MVIIINNLFELHLVSNGKKFDWKEKWIKRSNDIREKYEIIKNKYYIIDDSINYYLEMSEYAIFLLKKYDRHVNSTFIQHSSMFAMDYDGVFNIIDGFKERDISEYLKMIFFKNIYNKIDIDKLLYYGIKCFDYDLVIARLIYPNYYFNEIDSIILSGKSDDDIKRIVNRIDEYKVYINSIVDRINRFKNKKIIIQI